MPAKKWGNMLQAAMPNPPTVDQFIKSLLEYDTGRSGSPEASGGSNLFGNVFEGSNVGAAPSGTTSNRKIAVSAALKCDSLLKQSGITPASLDEWLEMFGRFKLSVDSLFADETKQKELCEERKQAGVDPRSPCDPYSRSSN